MNENETNQQEETTTELRHRLMIDYTLLEKLKAFDASDVGLLVNDELTQEYQRAFNQATTLKDAHEVKANIDYMKGVGFAMGIVKNLIINLEDDIDYKKENLELQETIGE